MQETLLNWIDAQQPQRLKVLRQWAEINSSSDNLPGLIQMMEALKQHFERLQGEMHEITLPPRTVIDDSGEPFSMPHGQALHIVKRPQATLKVFLGGHMDTVFASSHQFQETEMDKDVLRGPGVADMKGGLMVMLLALEAFEQHPAAQNIGWELVINPDEEIGSMGSEALLRACAKRNTLGLIFEPTFADGAFVSSRKGSANYTVVARGRAAHAGRDFDRGRNAVTAMARLAVDAEALNNTEKGISINVGHMSGGGPVNIVPDLAIGRFNVRAIESKDFAQLQRDMEQLVRERQSEGIVLSLYQHAARQPKPFDTKSQTLFKQLQECAAEESCSLSLRASGGVCDGNILAAEGLPVVDTLGVVGGELHTSNEYMVPDSLRMKARLAALFLMKLASGAWKTYD